MPKRIFTIAKADGREYITPEDVRASIRSGLSESRVNQDLLAAMGGTKFDGKAYGVEDWRLCAFVASRYGNVMNGEGA